MIGVASYDNTHIPPKTFTVTPDDRAIGYQTMTGAADPPTSRSLDLAKTGTTTTTNDACSLLTAGSLTGKAVLIRRGTCTFRTKAVNAVNAGAAAVMICQTLDPVALKVDRMPRNRTAGGLFAFGWDGRLIATHNGNEFAKNMPDGDYKLRVEILRRSARPPRTSRPTRLRRSRSIAPSGSWIAPTRRPA